ncbi:putative phosphatase YcdX [Candidatus Profftia lariciata]|uniref:phosphatase n=1 Tax=Candidatus Profftia lariciata TaxID=1987921 RepID=UPI001D020130|nr:phosphatase [Candidatus Profftia lariciata]UDG81487.1 putative phosphatase YcdX [Candidatus Profftia lariciata]
MYPVDLHMHTVASTHAYSTLHDYIIQANKCGIKMLAITDHGPDMEDAPHYWHFMNMRLWPRVVDGIAILRGIESNIKNIKGEIDCNDRMLHEMDLIIAGLHEPVFPPENYHNHTQAMISTMAKGNVDIISHPGNPKFPIDICAVAEAAACYNVALELNNSSFINSRIGSANNCRKIAEAVSNAGGYLALGTDSHVAFSLGNFEYCIRIINEIEFPNNRILNVSPRRLLNFLIKRGKSEIIELSDW